MNGLEQILQDAGYETLSADELLAIPFKKGNADGALCSGYGVFPGGEKCRGCEDCERAAPNEERLPN